MSAVPTLAISGTLLLALGGFGLRSAVRTSGSSS